MAIAKVEPLTTARALRGPFDYLLPERLAEVGVGSVLLVPFGRRRLLGVVVEVAESSELPPERLAEPIEALEAGRTPELVRLGLWVAREYCSTPPAGLELVLPPGVGRRRARPRPEARARWPRPLRPAGRRSATATAARRAPARALASSPRDADAGGRARRRRAPARRGVGPPDPQPPRGRGLVALRDARSAAPRPSIVRGRRAVARPRALRRAARRAGAIVAAIDGAASASSCCTASPARARPRSTSRPPRRRSRAAGGRSSSFPRSR